MSQFVNLKTKPQLSNLTVNLQILTNLFFSSLPSFSNFPFDVSPFVVLSPYPISVLCFVCLFLNPFTRFVFDVFVPLLSFLMSSFSSTVFYLFIDYPPSHVLLCVYLTDLIFLPPFILCVFHPSFFIVCYCFYLFDFLGAAGGKCSSFSSPLAGLCVSV